MAQALLFFLHSTSWNMGVTAGTVVAVLHGEDVSLTVGVLEWKVVEAEALI